MSEGGLAGDGAGPERTHVVLVPGFVGFDALGSLEYYAGVTRIFDDWMTKPVRPRAALHYFDNFPTASVKLRSERLVGWLAKRVARGEFGPRDRVALVGHSTGGLDIRKAVRTLASAQRDEIILDGSSRVANQEVLDRIARLVFLSVPHYGTNLGDLGCALSDAAKSLLKDAALGIRLNRAPFAAARRALTSLFPAPRSDLLLAVLDALDESDEDRNGPLEHLTAEREARAEFALWIEHMSDDFSVVADLRSCTDLTEGSGSPAHASPDERARELETWKTLGIATRSYATHVPRSLDARSKAIDFLLPLVKQGGRVIDRLAVPVNAASDLWPLPLLSLPSLALRIGLPVASLPAVVSVVNADPKILFDLFQAVCADPSGSFRHPNKRAANGIADHVVDLASGAKLRTDDVLSTADSDGVVNTLSMCWPYDPADPDSHPIHIVAGDHGDIIGHYVRTPALSPAPNGRKYVAYDFFQSRAGFGETDFRRVWEDVFEFSTRP